MSKQYYVYILANKENGTLYVGVTSDLVRRIYQHKQKTVESFAQKYDVDKLVYYEITDSIESAIRREKRFKKYPRRWKLNLINQFNPEWEDLYEQIIGLPA